MANPRQLIVCCDGTNNNVTGNNTNTNVIKLQSCLAGDPDQLVFYDPGVGNAGVTPSATWGEKFKARYERLQGLAFGTGVYENIAECYTFLANNYEDGDEIYLFGFSRGAFTARAVSGLIQHFGLIRAGQDNLLPTLLHLYFRERDSDTQKDEFKEAAEKVRHLFTPDDRAQVWVHFIGVWDTVASIGLPPFDRQITGDPTMRDKRFRHVRQALAKDEYRQPFEPRRYKEDNFAQEGRSLKQVWFPGAHSDVGGGYASVGDLPDGGCGLSNQTLEWMRAEAAAIGLRMSPHCVEPQTVARVHSETHNVPLWALAGFEQREIPTDAAVHGAGATPLTFPADTVWRFRLHWGWIVGPILAYVMAMFLTVVALLGAVPDDWNAAKEQFRLLAVWHAWPVLPADLPMLRGEFPRTALMFESIAGFASLALLAALASWAFAWIAGLRAAALAPPPLLAKLGKAPKYLAVAAAVNHLGSLSFALLTPWAWEWVSALLRVFAGFGWWAQWPLVAAVLLLGMWGAVARIKR